MAFIPESHTLQPSDLRTDSDVKAYFIEALRLSNPDDMRLNACYEAAVEIVLRRSPTAFTSLHGRRYDVPTAIHNLAIVKLTGYLFDAPDSPGGAGWANAWNFSGAHGLIAHFTQPRAGKI